MLTVPQTCDGGYISTIFESTIHAEVLMLERQVG
jgi:hypothetical protein